MRECKPGDIGIIIHPRNFGKQVLIIEEFTFCDSKYWNVETREPMTCYVIDELIPIPAGCIANIEKRYVIPLKDPDKQENTETQEDLHGDIIFNV